MGILVEPFDMKKYDFIQLPATDIWGVLMRKDSPPAEKEHIQPEDLWELPLLTSRQTMAQKELMAWLGKGREELHIVSTYNLIYNASIMVEEGIGSALCIDNLVNTTGSKLCFRPFEPRITANLIVAWKKYQVFSKASELFLHQLQEALCERK